MRRAALILVALVSAVVAADPSAGGAGPAMAGDFDGDGLGDVAMGVPDEDLDTVAGGESGAVNVIYGSVNGLSDGPPDSAANQFWTQGGNDMGETADPGEELGEALASADFDGDGYADLAIGVPGEDIDAEYDAGVVQVLYGGVDGLQAVSPDDQVFSQGSGGVRGTAQAEDRFGAALAAGDFDADGYGDLAVGIPADHTAVAQAGAVAVLHGSAAGLQADAPNDVLLTQDTTNVEDVAEPFDRFGAALATGDLNGDGYADLAVGAPGEDTTVDDAGAVAVLFGSASGLDLAGDQLWHQDTGGVRGTPEIDDELGSALATGDFDDDGHDDLAAGIPLENRRGVADVGAVAVLYGSSAGPQVTAPDDELWTQGTAGVRNSPEAADRFGSSLTAGDFDGDGHDDLVAGVPYETIGGVPETGAVAVVYGSGGGLQVTAPDDQLWHEGVAGVCNPAVGAEHYGWAVLDRDIDGDGYADLAVGVPGEGIVDITGAQYESGVVHVLYGTASGLDALGDQCIRQGVSYLDQYEAYDHFGEALG